MEVLSVLEYESLPIKESRESEEKALELEHVNALDRLEKDLDGKVWSRGNNQIKFSQYCGVLALGNLCIEVLPKIYGKELEPESSRKALVRMLAVNRRLKLLRAGSAEIALQKNTLLDIFILHFCDQLHAEMMQGLIRTYVTRNENLNVLRGRLLIHQQFKQNLAHRERLFCQYDELSEDNTHNQILKYVLKILLKMATGQQALRQVTELLMHFDAFSDIAVDLRLIESLSFNRSTTRYEPIFDQCKWFIEGMKPDVLSGNTTCISLLFDMNRLFEGYVGNEFRKKAWSQGLHIREQSPQRYFASREDIDQDVFMMKPDIACLNPALKPDDQVIAIADAKWKELNDEKGKLEISQADLYQIESYALRYGVKNVFLVYPMQKNMTKTIRLRLHGSNVSVKVVPLDIADDKHNELPDLLAA